MNCFFSFILVVQSPFKRPFTPPPLGYTLTSLRDDIESGSKTAAAARGAKSFENLGRDFLLLGGAGGGVWERELKCGTFLFSFLVDGT